METIKDNTVRQKNQPSRELRQLDVFVGKWNVEGENLNGAPSGSGEKVVGIATYEWLSGKFFLVNRWSRKFGSESHIGLGVIGFDAENKGFITSNFDNLGFARTYKLKPDRLKWRFVGSNERAIIEFSPDTNKFTEYWEVSGDGKVWKPLCRLKGTRLL